MMHLALITHFNRLNCDRVWLLDVSAAAAAPPAVMAEAVAEYMVIVPNLHFALHFNFC